MKTSGARMNFRNTRVLVIEDNPHALEIISQILVGFGISHSQKCETMDDAYNAVDKSQFDIILADGEMKGGDGFAFTRRVRSDPGGCNFTTPVIIVSGCPTRQKIIDARDAGASFVIAKPMSPGILLARMTWIAKNDREFIVSDTYRGPDRRFRNLPLPPGIEERRAAALRIAQSPERDLSQDEIDALF